MKTLSYIALRLEQPNDLHETLQLYAAWRTLRSSHQNLLAMPISRNQDCLSLIFRRNATHCVSPIAIDMCVCVCVYLCVCICVYAAFVDARKTV